MSNVSMCLGVATALTALTTTICAQAANPPPAHTNPTTESGPVDSAKVSAVTPRQSKPMRPNQFEFGVGLGGSLPTGKFAQGSAPISDVSVMGLLGAGALGYRFFEHFYIGVYVEGGVAPVSSSGVFAEACDSDTVTCSAALVRYGAEVRYMFNPADQWGWWLGLGVGQDYFGFSAKLEETDETVAVITASGTEFLLRGGVNLIWDPMTSRSVDLFAGYGLGQFSDVEVTALSNSTKLTEPAMHGWILLGAMAVF